MAFVYYRKLLKYNVGNYVEGKLYWPKNLPGEADGKRRLPYSGLRAVIAQTV
jgi:hypothetical protein